MSTTKLFEKSAETHHMHLPKMARIVTQDPQIPMLRASGDIARRGMGEAWVSYFKLKCKYYIEGVGEGLGKFAEEVK